ncbi:integrase family protein [Bradyrhizobium yuanmingense]|uniref:tyrosine-type recombinase/integrase n=1 Tax=Bradyrhizobium yuanmingense TaxID=108015 RepID=UPI0023B99A9E|nr:integrase family protein [Bradyrhizobium yuanmingense]MDF0523161.1 integrase family protein [Bradyrhizobium yuanmingense]
MPKKRLTALAIPTLASGEWYDQGVAGLILRVGKRRRSWQFRYHAGGSYHRKPLGHFPAMELAEAREAARKLIDRIDRGVPPEAPAPHPRASSALTLGGLFDRYETLRKREGKKIKTLDEAMRLLRRNLASYLSLPAHQFSKADLRAARDAMVDADAMIAGNRLLQRLGPVLRWAAQEDLIPANFVPDIRRAPEQKRSRVLTKKEIGAIWKACGGNLGTRDAAKNFGRMVRFLLVTAQRRDEAASLRHGHILDGTWRQATNKSDRPHTLKLPPLALTLVGQGAAQEYVFAGSNGKISGFSKLKTALDKASGVSNWRLHDLRRTAATNMQELGIPNHIVQSVLNHSLPGVGGVYLRSELEEQKAEALATWATAVTQIVGKGRVVA